MISLILALLMPFAHAQTNRDESVCFSYLRADLTSVEANTALRSMGIEQDVIQFCDVNKQDLAFRAELQE